MNDGSNMSDFGLPEPMVINTELDRERIRYDPAEQRLKLLRLNQECPNTPEQEILFQRASRVINSDSDTDIIFIQGEAGTGKTTFAEKILALTRSLGKIGLGCAATNLAAQVYIGDSFTTAHDLFGIPVTDDDDELDSQNEVSFRKHIILVTIDIIYIYF